MISDDFVNKYTAQRIGNESSLGFVSQADDFIASTVVDIGTSLWNSIVAIPSVFGADTSEYRASTYDTLRSVNEDWANFYLESKDAVETASFIGGLLIPGGAALKGMKVLQAGKTAFYPRFLTDATQASRISELQKMLELGGKATSEYRNLRWKILSTNAGQETLQAIGAELAIIGTMSQHAYMEDYLKDPVKNIAIGIGIGGVLGSGLGQIAIRKTLANSLGSIASKSLETVQRELIEIPLGISDVDKVQRYSINANILRGLAEDKSQTPLVREIANDFAIAWEGRAGQLEQTSVFGPGLMALTDREAKQQARAIMLSDAAYGANRVDITKFDDREYVRIRSRGKEFFTREAQKSAEGRLLHGSMMLSVDEFAVKTGEDIGGVSHLKGIVTGLQKTYINQGEKAGRVMLDDLAKNAPESSGFIKEVATPGFLDELHAELVKRAKEFEIGVTQDQAILGRIANMSKTMKYALTASEALSNIRPDWIDLMKTGFRISYSPFHKAWIPSDQIAFYSRAVDTGASQWENIPAILRPNPDAFSDFIPREVPTAKADKYWVNTLGSVFNASLEGKVYIAEGDLGVQNAWLARLSALGEESKKIPEVFLVPDTVGDVTVGQLKKQGRLVSISELEDNLASKKTQLAKEMVQAGASTQEIGIRLNMSTNTVESLLMSRTPLKEAGTWRLYTDPGRISTEYLSQRTRMLDFTTNGKKLASLYNRNADMSARLDSKFIREQNIGIMSDIIARSKSDMVRQFYQTLDADRSIWDTFNQQLSNIVNEKAGSFFFTSADFASRRMGDVSAIATAKGQELFGIFNSVSQRQLTPLATITRQILLSQSTLNEFNETINILSSISGYRGIADLSDESRAWSLLFRLVEQEPGVFVRQPVMKPDGSELAPSELVMSWLREMQRVGQELFQFKNTTNEIQGFKELNDIGLWIPTFNPANKFISYVIDNQAAEGSSRVKLLAGRSPEELASLERDWKSKFGQDSRFTLITKAQQEDYNFWQMRQDPIEMDFADITKFHSGASGLALTPVDESFTSTVIENLHNRIIHYGRKLQEMYLSDIMTQLDDMSALNQKHIAAQPTLVTKVGLSQREDAARAMKNVLLGNSQLGNYSTWKTINNGFTSMVEWTSRKTQELYRGIISDPTKISEKDFVKLTKELEGMGISNPFRDFGEFQIANAERLQASKFQIRKTGEIGQYGGEALSLLKEGKEIAIVDGEAVGDTFYVNWIGKGPTKVEPGVASTARDLTQEKVSIGIKGLREYSSQIRSLYPNVKRVSGERISGVRADKATFDLDMTVAAPMITRDLPQVPQSTLNRRDRAAQLDKLITDTLARRNNIPYATAEQLVATGNSTLATFALRVLETGHAFITAISWPIMTLPEIYRGLPKTFLGNPQSGEAITAMLPARAIYDGIRFRHSDAAKPLIARWIEEGFGKPIVSEATELTQLLHATEAGVVGKINRILNSDLIKTLATPSDFAESETRLWGLSTGYQLAKRMYPGISENGADLFAKEFLAKTVGNYYAAQRPAIFQGTFGVAIGLFQTYMLTWAQQMFRNIEEQSFRAIASQMLTQAGMFGMSSMPLYDMFSKTIGANFSDKHYDLTTGTYRALPDQLAEFVVYGLPASLGVGVYTRGDLQPRLPFTQQNPTDTIAAVNAARQFIGAVGHSLEKVYQANGTTNKFRGLLEGMAMQSLSRPLARIVEATPIPDGQGGFRAVGAISREGNTISTSEEVWSAPGLMSRLLTSRATEEQVKREVDYLNTFYGSVDYRNRKRATEALKSAIRGGTLDDKTLESVAGEYLRTGTSTGWTAALNEALATSEGGIDYKLGKRLRPDSPFQRMLQDTY